MKKIFYTSSLIAIASLSVLTSCKKDSEAFPTKAQTNGTYPDLTYTTPYFPSINDADGILISAQVTNEKTVVISPYFNSYEYGMAKFASTTGNFSSLADAGSVTVNDSTLAKSSNLSYLSSTSTYSLNFSNAINWNVGGNGSVAAFTYSFSAVNPTYSYNITNWDSKWTPIYPKSLTVGSTTYHADSLYNETVQYTVPIKNYTSNADTVIIAMVDANGFSYIRKVPATDSLASFKPNDFNGYSSYDFSTFKFQVNAIKYNSSAINSKKYYFLQMASYIKYYQATK